MLAGAGLVTGWARGIGALVVVAAVALLLLLSAAASRTLAASLAAALTSRRGRDAAILIGALVFMAAQGLRFVHFGALDAAVVHRVADWLRWLPPGMLGQAVSDARDGSVVVAVLELIPASVALWLLTRVWSLALVRAATVESGSGRRAVRADPAAPPKLALRSRLGAVLPLGPVYAVAAKELRYLTRGPRRRLLVVQTFLLGVVGPIFVVARTGSALGAGSVLFATAAGYLAVLNAMNQFGFDGAALWTDVVAGNDVRAELIGKNLAIAAGAVPLIAASAVVLAGLSGGWTYVPIAVVLGLGGLGAGLAVADVVSVRWPMRLSEARSPFAANGQGQGCVTSVIVSLCALVQGLLLAPIAIAASVAAAVAPAALVPVAAGAALYGFGLWRAGVAMAERWAWWRQPELLLAVHPRRE